MNDNNDDDDDDNNRADERSCCDEVIDTGAMLDENLHAGAFRLLLLSGALPGSNLSDPMT